MTSDKADGTRIQALHGSARAQTLLADIRSRALKRFAKLLSEMLDKADDTLFDFVQRGDGSLANQDYFDAMRELRKLRPVFEQRHAEHLISAFAALERRKPLEVDLERSVGDASSGELSLISEEQLEEQLGTSMVAMSWSRLLGPLQAQLNHRIGVLIGLPDLDSNGNPIAPPHLAYAFRYAMQACELPVRVKLLLFKLYEREWAHALAEFQNETNQALIDAGIVPEIRPTFTRMPMPTARGPGSVHAAAVTDAQNMVLPQPGPGERYIRVPETLAEQSVFASLHELLASWRRHQGQDEGHAADALLAPQMSGDEVMSVLSLFQSEMPQGLQEAVSDPDSSITLRIKQELMRGAEQLGLDPKSRMTTADEDSIDLVGMLFEVMLDERDFNTDSRQLIGRLIVPFIKVAMLDRRMFLQKTHPARRLLNALAEACEGNDGQAPHERELMTRAQGTVDRLVSEFNEDIAIFETLEQEFREFIEQHRRRVALAERRTAEAQRGKERLDHARTMAMQELHALSERHPELPATIEAFLRRYWTHHLTLCVLRTEDEDNEKYNEAVATGEALATLAHSGDVFMRAEVFDDMQPQLAPILVSAGCIGSAARDVVESLRHALGIGVSEAPSLEEEQETVSMLERNAPPVESLPPEPVVIEEESPGAGLDYEESDAERVRRLQVGCWVQFIEEDGSTIPAKLSWISPISNRMLFVNRRGLRYCVASPEELAAMMHQNRLNIRQADAAFEHAMSQVLGRLRSSGTSPAA